MAVVLVEGKGGKERVSGLEKKCVRMTFLLARVPTIYPDTFLFFGSIAFAQYQQRNRDSVRRSCLSFP